VQHNHVRSTNLLIHQKALDVGSLIPLKLNNFLLFFVLLHSTVTGEVFLEGLANALNVQILRETSYGRDTLATISLLHSNVNLLFGGMTTVTGVFEGVCRVLRV
jgi:hypothetical protein